MQSTALSDLFTRPSRIWTFGPVVTLPIFNSGRNRANIALAEARQQELLIRYEQTILHAFRGLEDALTAHHKTREALTAHRKTVQASREEPGIAEYRHKSGLTSYLNVLDAQRTLITQEIAESRTLLAQLVTVVRIYRALGGGWDTDLHQGGWLPPQPANHTHGQAMTSASRWVNRARNSASRARILRHTRNL
ncbi:TolC family protein [Desulfatitalea sp. M08but]|uniref:TolC family protein n=1 Tax=Desulfatitalea alkaliphila TaxID=2929485 RepID=A0AA41R3U7_9BACT|nr:TolC family protein [Desulfatitalea alkaliphila]